MIKRVIKVARVSLLAPPVIFLAIMATAMLLAGEVWHRRIK